MKNKGSASLYEVLKSASRPPDGAGAAASEATPPPSAPEGAGQPTLQERLAAYKAAKLAAVTPLVPAVSSVPQDETPAPTPVAEVRPSTPAVPAPGERVLRLTYNTAVFAGLVVLGLLFVAYAIGLQTGRKRGLEAAALEAPAPVPPPPLRESVVPVPDTRRPPPPPPPPAPKEYTIRAAEWKYGTAQERLKADAAADDLKRALDRANFRGSKKEVIQRGGEPRLALYLDTFTDPALTAVKSRLSSIQKLKVGTQTPFTQAQIEESPK